MLLGGGGSVRLGGGSGLVDVLEGVGLGGAGTLLVGAALLVGAGSMTMGDVSVMGARLGVLEMPSGNLPASVDVFSVGIDEKSGRNDASGEDDDAGEDGHFLGASVD